MSNIIRNALNNKRYEMLRKKAMNRITWHLGNVVETKDELICYINLKNVNRDSISVSICIPGVHEQHKKLAFEYNLTKPIRYVLDGFETKKQVSIHNYCDEVVLDIKNCKFLGTVFDLKSRGKCSISDSNIRTYSMLNLIGNDLTINNLKIYTIADNFTTMIAGDDKLDINRLVLKRHFSKKANLYVYSKGVVNISNTSLEFDNVDIDAKDIRSEDNSKIVVRDNIIIENNAKTDNLRIESPKLIYNGMTIDSVEINTTLTPLLLKKLELAETLKKVAEKIDKTNQTLIDSYKKNLEEHQVVGDTLKRIR